MHRAQGRPGHRMTAYGILMIAPNRSQTPETGAAVPLFVVRDAVIDTDRRMVLKDGRLTPLEPRVWAVLEYLLAHRDRVVTREELVREVWKGLHVVDEAVMRTISVLRDAFGDDPKSPRFIETATKRGYRFIGAPGGAPTEPAAPRLDRRLWLAAGGLAAAVFLGGLATGLALRPQPSTPQPIRMIDMKTGEVKILPQP